MYREKGITLVNHLAYLRLSNEEKMNNELWENAGSKNSGSDWKKRLVDMVIIIGELKGKITLLLREILNLL